MRHLLLPTATIFLGLACADPTDPDAGPGADATITDSGLDAGTTDTGSDSGSGDSGSGDSGPTDTGPLVDGSYPCSGAFTLDTVVEAGNTPTFTIFPDGPSPTIVNRIAETGVFIAGQLSRVSAAGGVEWTAQISQLTMFDRVDFDHVLLDPIDGSIYAALEQQLHDDTTSMRFYNADGTLGVELVRDGTAGLDLVGQGRQSNFLLVKYDAAGVLQWVSRFGPNSPGTDRAGRILSVGFTPTGIRVVGQAEGATEIVMAPGTTSELTYTSPNAPAFWGELSKADGSYVAGSLRRIDSDDARSNPNLVGNAFTAHSTTGETAIGGVLVRNSGSPTFTIGAGGPGAVTLTSSSSRTIFGKIGVDGAPVFVGTVEPVSGGPNPEPRAVGLSPNGEVVGGGQFSVLAGETRFRGVGSEVRLTYEAQQSFLVGYSATGEVRWAKLLLSTHRNVVSRIVVTADAAYVMGIHATNQVLGPGEPNETTIRGTGYTLSKYALADGAFQWVRSFSDATGTGTGASNAYDLWSVGNRLIVPTLTVSAELRVVGGAVDRLYSGLGLRAVIFEANGDLADCQPIAGAGAAGFTAF